MPQTAAPSEPQKLDDVMIAMDVVDTLRHREDLVAREFNEEGRESDLIARLRQIYRDQGIEVPDNVLAEGVKALKDSRFVYMPPPPSWKRTWLTWWVKRETYGKRLAIAVAAIVALLAGYHFLITRPAKLAEERARIEVTETLPRQIRQAHTNVLAVAGDDAAKQRAAALLTDGELAIRSGDRAAMTRIGAQLTALRDEVTREYTLTIVSRAGESTGVWRRPPHGGQARNYIAALDLATNTNNATAWNPSAGSLVKSVAISGTTAYVGGYFTSIGGQSRKYLAALSTTIDTNNATAWDPNPNGPILSLAATGTTVYVAGSFGSIGGQSRNHIARLDATTGFADSFNPNANDNVDSIVVLADGRILVGGVFITIGGEARNRIARLDATSALARFSWFLLPQFLRPPSSDSSTYFVTIPRLGGRNW